MATPPVHFQRARSHRHDDPVSGGTHTVATILIVDDEPLNCKLLETQLRPEGYITITAATGEEALACVARSVPDLILLDIMMPGMDGFDVAATLKAAPATANVPIIMVTASLDRESRLSALHAGAEEFLIKPVDRVELSLRVRNLLRLKELADFHRAHGASLEMEVRTRTAELGESEARFRQMAENIQDVYFLMEAPGSSMLYVSPAYQTVWGRSCESLYAHSEDWLDAVHADERPGIREKFTLGVEAGNFGFECRIVRPDGSIRWIEARGYPVLDEAGVLVRVAGVAIDITGRKAAEAGIRRLNRMHEVLSGIDSVIVRVRELDELFTEACRIAVENGGFLLAWIGTVDGTGAGTTAKIRMVASAGTTDVLLDAIEQRLASDEGVISGRSLVARAMQDGCAVVSNDSQNDPLMNFPEEQTACGIRSMAILPLMVAGAGAGVLALYAGERGVFDDEEMKLLNELAGDIAFAIDHIGKRDRLDYLAYYDALTGLANRALFLDRVSQYIRAAAIDGHRLCLFMVDLERFRNINDSLGRASGDALLVQVAQWLTETLGDANLSARIGADHFAVVMPHVRETGDVAKLLERTLASFMRHPFHQSDASFRLSARVGAAIYPDDAAHAESLLRNAEAALRKAKAGGERALFYTRQMGTRTSGTFTLENQLRRALEQEEFVLHYQPKVNLASGAITGAEALIRWNDPRTGLVPPGRFIPVLEETGLIYDVGRWALRRAIEDYLRWRAAGLPAVRIAVNVSPLQLRNRGFVDEIVQVIGIDPDAAAGLELEITESLIMEAVNHSIASLKAIREAGVTIAIDDFGTGYSSLSYLARLPVDTLKIDRSFVTDMTASPEGLALVSTIIKLAQSLKLKVVAEGVETEEQSRLLRLLSCGEIQGFLFSKPVPGEEFAERFLR